MRLHRLGELPGAGHPGHVGQNFVKQFVGLEKCDVIVDACRRFLARQEAAARVDDYVTFFEADELFHEVLADMAGVPGAWQLAQTVKAHVDRERFILMSSIHGRSQRAFDDHMRILAAIRSQDADRAEAEMVGHIETVLNASGP